LASVPYTQLNRPRPQADREDASPWSARSVRRTRRSTGAETGPSTRSRAGVERPARRTAAIATDRSDLDMCNPHGTDVINQDIREHACMLLHGLSSRVLGRRSRWRHHLSARSAVRTSGAALRNQYVSGGAPPARERFDNFDCADPCCLPKPVNQPARLERTRLLAAFRHDLIGISNSLLRIFLGRPRRVDHDASD